MEADLCFGHGGLKLGSVVDQSRQKVRTLGLQVRKRDSKIKSLRENNSQIWYKFVFEFVFLCLVEKNVKGKLGMV